MFFRALKYESSLQWCLRLSLKPGQYLFIYECCFELINDLKFCFRVFNDNEECIKNKASSVTIIKKSKLNKHTNIII